MEKPFKRVIDLHALRASLQAVCTDYGMALIRLRFTDPNTLCVILRDPTLGQDTEGLVSLAGRVGAEDYLIAWVRSGKDESLVGLSGLNIFRCLYI